MAKKRATTELDARNLGLAAGILWGLVFFFTTLLSVGSGYGAQFLAAYGSIHPGYSISVAGSIVGLIYGFICGFVGLYLLARIYNWLNKKR